MRESATRSADSSKVSRARGARRRGRRSRTARIPAARRGGRWRRRSSRRSRRAATAIGEVARAALGDVVAGGDRLAARRRRARCARRRRAARSWPGPRRASRTAASISRATSALRGRGQPVGDQRRLERDDRPARRQRVRDLRGDRSSARSYRRRPCPRVPSDGPSRTALSSRGCTERAPAACAWSPTSARDGRCCGATGACCTAATRSSARSAASASGTSCRTGTAARRSAGAAARTSAIARCGSTFMSGRSCWPGWARCSTSRRSGASSSACARASGPATSPPTSSPARPTGSST